MTQAQHTPGPWATNGPALIVTNDAWHHEIAIVKNQNNNHSGSNVSPEESEANACLIAAAPELLEALELLMNSRWLSIDHDYNRTRAACDLREVAIAAINKARGIES
jgi:hypothetical protein